jgi:hypothetical protein
VIPPAKRGGNKRTVNERQLVNGLMYVLSTGCQWTSLPKDLPPRSTVNHYFRRWDHDGTLDCIDHSLYVILILLNSDTHPVTVSDRLDSVWVVDQKRPGVPAGRNDGLVAVPNESS